MTEPFRGNERERELPKEIYFAEDYFSMRQLCSFAHQLNFIYSMRPKSVIEVGVGNGFVSTFLRRAGFTITTADINPQLDPDICAPIDKIRDNITTRFDLVVCCEVLEHMPLHQLDANLDYLKDLGDRLFLTLPNSFKTWGMSGFAFLPKLGIRNFDFAFDTPFKHPIAGGPHFWEVGLNSGCTRRKIEDLLGRRYKSVRSGRFKLNPYHLWFICE